MPTVQTMETNDVLKSSPADSPVRRPQPRKLTSAASLGARLRRGLAFNRIGAVYVWLGLVLVFSIWVPDTFPTMATVKQVLNANAITALAALSITIPLAAPTR